MSSSPQTVFKVTLIGGPTRIIPFPSRPTWLELIPRILTLFRIPDPAQTISLIYIDSDGDEITISSHEELSQYYDEMLPDQILKLSFRLSAADHQVSWGEGDISYPCSCGTFSESGLEMGLSSTPYARCAEHGPFDYGQDSNPCPPGRSSSSYPYHSYDPPLGFYDYPHGTWSEHDHQWSEGNEQDGDRHYRSYSYSHDMMDAADDERIISHIQPPPSDNSGGVRRLTAGMEDMTLT